MTQIAQLKKKILLLFFNWNHLLFLVFPKRKKRFKLGLDVIYMWHAKLEL